MMRKVWVMCALLMSLLLLGSAALAQDWLPRVPESPDAMPAPPPPPHKQPDPRNPSAGQPHIHTAKPPQLRASHPSKVATKAPEKLHFRRIWGSDDAPGL